MESIAARTHLFVAQLIAFGGEFVVERVQKRGRVQQRVEEGLQLGARHVRVAVLVEQAKEDWAWRPRVCAGRGVKVERAERSERTERTESREQRAESREQRDGKIESKLMRAFFARKKSCSASAPARTNTRTLDFGARVRLGAQHESENKLLKIDLLVAVLVKQVKQVGAEHARQLKLGVELLASESPRAVVAAAAAASRLVKDGLDGRNVAGLDWEDGDVGQMTRAAGRK